MSKRLRRRNHWKNYAAATAGVVGSAVGMEADVARADLVWDVNPDVTISSNGAKLYLDVNQNGTDPDFISTSAFFGNDVILYLYTGSAAANTYGSSSEILQVPPGGFLGDVKKLAPGYSVSSTSTSWGGSFGVLDTDAATGPWNGSGDGFLGVRLANGADFNYGWVHLSYDEVASTLTVHEFAYNEVVGAAIVTAAIPEANSLAACSLALGGVLGAQGVLGYRRKKALATA
jgi:hypothetical protein